MCQNQIGQCPNKVVFFLSCLPWGRLHMKYLGLSRLGDVGERFTQPQRGDCACRLPPLRSATWSEWFWWWWESLLYFVYVMKLFEAISGCFCLGDFSIYSTSQPRSCPMNFQGQIKAVGRVGGKGVIGSIGICDPWSMTETRSAGKTAIGSRARA